METFLKPRKQFFTIEDAQEYQLVTVQLHARGIKERSRVRGSDIKTKKQQHVKAGDLLVAEIDAKVGGYGIVPRELDGSIVSGHYFLYEIDLTIVEPKFLGFYLRSGQPEEDVKRFVKGALNYAAIRPYHFPQLEIPLPPLAEQQRIAARIEALAARIEVASRLQGAAIEQVQPAIAVAQLALFKQISELHDIRPIGDLFTYRSELIHPRNGTKGEIRFVGLQHIEPHTGRRLGEDFVLAEELKGRKFRFSAGEIVYGYLRPYLNKVWIADRDGICSVDQYVLRPKRDIVETDYLAHFMRSPMFLNQAVERTHSLTLPRLQTGLLESIPIPIPPKNEQHRIVAYLDAVRARVDALKREQTETQAELDALLPAILDKAFRGEL